MGRWLIVCLICASGCVHSNSVTCGDLVCPEASTCDVATGLCIPPGCGDGIVNGSEDCDGTALGSAADCRGLGFYVPGTLGCTPQCRYDTTQCTETCGDDRVNGPELCDGAPPPGFTCADFGYGVGRIACSSVCSPAFGDCSSIGLRTVFTADRSLAAIIGTSPTDMFAFGGHGLVLHGNGTGWAAMPSNTSDSLQDAWRAPDGTIFAVGGTTIVRYDGQTWTPTTIAGVDHLNGVWGRTANDVWVVGGSDIGAASAGKVVHWDGAAWSAPLAVANTHVLHGVAGDGGHVVAVGELHSTAVFDGATWTGTMTGCASCISTSYTYNRVLAVPTGAGTTYVAVGANGQIAGDFSVVASSTDGTTWTSLGQDKVETGLLGIAGTSLDDLYIVGAEGTFLRYDGARFHQIVTGAVNKLTALWIAAPDSMRVVAGDGTIRSYDGIAWADTQPILPVDDIALSGVATQGTQTIAVGESGTALVTTDGVAWTAIGGVPATSDLTGVWIAPTGEAFATSFQGKGVYERAAAGGNFAQVVPLLGVNLQAVWGTSATDVYAVGVGAGVFHRNAAGWSQVFGTGRALYGIWGSSAADVFAVGDFGTILHTTDGTTWTVMTSNTLETLQGIWGSAPDDVFAVGGAGTILHFDGVGWQLQHSGNQALAGVFGTVPRIAHRADDVFAYGVDTLFHYDGTAWSNVLVPVQFDAVAAASRDTAARQQTMFVGTRDIAITLDRVIAASEVRCGNGWDDDGNGLVDCADTGCATSEFCASGGACRIVATVACGTQALAGTTNTGVGRVDSLPTIADLTTGPEATYRFFAAASGPVTVTLASASPLDLLVTKTYGTTSACDLDSPVGASSGPGSVTFTATAGMTYAFVVDEPAGSAGTFALSVDCM